MDARKPGRRVAIVGARNPAQSERSAPAAELELSDDDLREIDRIMDGAVPLGGPTPEDRADAVPVAE